MRAKLVVSCQLATYSQYFDKPGSLLVSYMPLANRGTLRPLFAKARRDKTEEVVTDPVQQSQKPAAAERHDRGPAKPPDKAHL